MEKYEVVGTIYKINEKDFYDGNKKRGGYSLTCYLNATDIASKGTVDGSVPLIEFVPDTADLEPVAVEQDDRVWVTLWVEGWDWNGTQRVNAKPNSGMTDKHVAELKQKTEGQAIKFHVANNATVKAVPRSDDPTKTANKLVREGRKVTIPNLQD